MNLFFCMLILFTEGNSLAPIHTYNYDISNRSILYPRCSSTHCLQVPSASSQAEDYSYKGSNLSWSKVSDSKLNGFSGAAVDIENRDNIRLVVVHDNKLPLENRLDVIQIKEGKFSVIPVVWNGSDKAIDIESISSIPNRTSEFIVLASNGKCFHIKIKGTSANTIKEFSLPCLNPLYMNNFESFRLKSIDGVIVAIWGDRGSENRPGLCYISRFLLDEYDFGAVSVYKIILGDNNMNERDISDIEIDESNNVIISSVIDPGDDGPYKASLSVIGKIQKDSNSMWQILSKNDIKQNILIPEEKVQFQSNHKIEGLSFIADYSKIILVSDDENLGGWISIQNYK